MKAVVFELDGALIDSERDLYAAANRMLDEPRRPPLPHVVDHFEDLPDTVARSVVLR
jgi:phosphoglycolate phosphatase-like HAD superfamily hydrolase